MSTCFGLYVHIPFCRTKCPYCAFDSAPDQDDLIDEYIETLCDEIAARPEQARSFDTVYFGGGTPGLLSEEHMGRITDFIRSELFVKPDAEWTIEVNPGDVTIDKASFWVKKAGFNRISLGVQSFEQNELDFLGRRHDVQDALDAISDCQMTGAKICIDLIQGLPGQNTEQRMRSVHKAASLKPSHISVYELTIDEGSAFHAAGAKFHRPDQDAAADGYLATSKYLRGKGYLHYEVSNYCLDTFDNMAAHNARYCQGRPWIGVGASDHSFDGTRRWWNVRGAAAYIQAMNQAENAIEDTEALTDDQLRLERVALGFRWMGGVARADLHADGVDDKLARLVREKLVMIRDDRVHSTVEGFLIADALARVLA